MADGDPGTGRTWQAAVVLAVAGTVLAAGLPVMLAGSLAARIGLGVGATAVIVLLAVAAGKRFSLAPARDGLLALAVLSLLAWVTASITAVPVLAQWLQGAPVPLAFLVVNATKLAPLAVLVTVARNRGWTRHALLVRVGDPVARTGIPGIRWPVLGPVVIVVVGALFLTGAPHTHHLDVGWLPVILAGAVVNAVAEELLYRHAVVGTMRTAIGTVPAVALSSVVFGLGHLTGNPGGLTGVLFTACYGAVCAAAMLRTRGLCWNVPIHVCGDVAVVCSLMLA